MEITIFEPQYPAENYTKRPNETALLSPLYDSTFKAIFTQETEESNLALKSFLSAVLGRQIKRVTVKNNEPVKETLKQKNMLFDVSVEFDNGELADIELQSHKEDYDFGTRAEILAARLLSNNAKKSKKNEEWISEKVYQISILNFQYNKGDNKEMRWYNMADSSGKKLTDLLNIIFIDLVTIRKKYKENSDAKFSPVEKWGLFFSYVDDEDKKDLIEKISDSDEGIMAAEKIVKEMSKADNNWYIQNSIWIAKRDEAARKAAARRKGLEEGRAEGLKQGLAKGHKQGLVEGHKQGLAEGRAEGHKKGLAEGAQQNAIENARNFLRMNLGTPEQIAQGCSLPLEKVLELQKSITVNA